ncbi:hypothetical protein DIPPA_34572 [Diplonema papillatum]|nr:hypothetical protein DIPPA_34572 [Diplonema papillatum]
MAQAERPAPAPEPWFLPLRMAKNKQTNEWEAEPCSFAAAAAAPPPPAAPGAARVRRRRRQRGDPPPCSKTPSGLSQRSATATDGFLASTAGGGGGGVSPARRPSHPYDEDAVVAVQSPTYGTFKVRRSGLITGYLVPGTKQADGVVNRRIRLLEELPPVMLKTPFFNEPAEHTQQQQQQQQRLGRDEGFAAAGAFNLRTPSFDGAAAASARQHHHHGHHHHHLSHSHSHYQQMQRVPTHEEVAALDDHQQQEQQQQQQQRETRPDGAGAKDGEPRSIFPAFRPRPPPPHPRRPERGPGRSSSLAPSGRDKNCRRRREAEVHALLFPKLAARLQRERDDATAELASFDRRLQSLGAAGAAAPAHPAKPAAAAPKRPGFSRKRLSLSSGNGSAAGSFSRDDPPPAAPPGVSAPSPRGSPRSRPAPVQGWTKPKASETAVARLCGTYLPGLLRSTTTLRIREALAAVVAPGDVSLSESQFSAVFLQLVSGHTPSPATVQSIFAALSADGVTVEYTELYTGFSAFIYGDAVAGAAKFLFDKVDRGGPVGLHAGNGMVPVSRFSLKELRGVVEAGIPSNVAHRWLQLAALLDSHLDDLPGTVGGQAAAAHQTWPLSAAVHHGSRAVTHVDFSKFLCFVYDHPDVAHCLRDVPLPQKPTSLKKPVTAFNLPPERPSKTEAAESVKFRTP